MNWRLQYIKKLILHNKKSMFLLILSVILGVAIFTGVQINVSDAGRYFKDPAVQNENVDVILTTVSGMPATIDMGKLQFFFDGCDINGMLNMSCQFSLDGKMKKSVLSGCNALSDCELITGTFPKDGQIMIPDGFSDRIEIGDIINLVTRYGTVNFEVSGFYSNKNDNKNTEYIITTLNSTQNIVNGEYFSKINIGLLVPDDAASLTTEFNSFGFSGWIAISVSEQFENEMKSFDGMFVGLNVLSFIALFICVIVIYSSINTFVENSYKRIAILRSMGMNRRHIFEIFIGLSMLIGFIAGVLGIAVGILITKAISSLIALSMNKIALSFSHEALSPLLIITILVGVVFLSAVAGLIPAIRSLYIEIDDGLEQRVHRKKISMMSKIILISAMITIFVFSVILFFVFENIFVKLLLLVVAAFTMTEFIVYPIVWLIIRIEQSLFPMLSSTLRIFMLDNIRKSVSVVFLMSAFITVVITFSSIIDGFKSSVNTWIDVSYSDDAVLYPTSITAYDEIKNVLDDKLINEYCYVYENTYEAYGNSVLIRGMDSIDDSFIVKSSDSFDEIYNNKSYKMVISTVMSRQMKLDIGDILTLEGENGKAEFEIVGICRLLENDGKVFFMSTDNFLSLYPSRSFSYISLKYNEHSLADIENFKEIYSNSFILYNHEEIKAIYDTSISNMFQIFTVILVFIYFICIFSSALLIIRIINEKQYHFAVLRGLGISKIQSVAIVGNAIGVCSLISCLIGVMLGYAMQSCIEKVMVFVADIDIPLKASSQNICLICLLMVVANVVAMIVSTFIAYNKKISDKIRLGMG